MRYYRFLVMAALLTVVLLGTADLPPAAQTGTPPGGQGGTQTDDVTAFIQGGPTPDEVDAHAALYLHVGQVAKGEELLLKYYGSGRAPRTVVSHALEGEA